MQVNLDDVLAGCSNLGLLRPLRFHVRLLLLTNVYVNGNLAKILEGPVVKDF